MKIDLSFRQDLLGENDSMRLVLLTEVENNLLVGKCQISVGRVPLGYAPCSLEGG